MLKDITLGQYFPGKSIVHRLDARTKIISTVAYMVVLFTAGNAASMALAVVFFLCADILSRVPLRQMLRGVKPILPVLLLTALLNAFYQPGNTLFQLNLGFWQMRVTWQGLEFAVFISIRLVFLIVGTSLMTYTTSPIALSDGLEGLLAPLGKLRVPVHELSMMMSIALRFIPTLIEETDKIMSAQKARGADFETGSLWQRMRALLPILVPLFVSAFRRADELALAMDCRCYRGGAGRTKLRRLRFAGRDYTALGVMALLFAAVLLLNRLL